MKKKKKLFGEKIYTQRQIGMKISLAPPYFKYYLNFILIFIRVGKT